MPVEVQLDAIKDRILQGVVTKVNQYAEPSSWSSGNIKEYAAFISIQDPPPEIRSGMNAEVRIHVEDRGSALQVPVQAVYETKGRHFCLVKDGQQWETRTIQVGSSNDNFMTVESGLKEDELVVMNPRAYPQRLQIPDLPAAEEPVKPQPPRKETGKPETGKPETGKPETGKPETEKPEAGKPEAGKSETEKPETGQAGEGTGHGDAQRRRHHETGLPPGRPVQGLRAQGRDGPCAAGSRWMFPKVITSRSWDRPAQARARC